jgi:hypothetical protein
MCPRTTPLPVIGLRDKSCPYRVHFCILYCGQKLGLVHGER